jgi:hypothetical protein
VTPAKDTESQAKSPAPRRVRASRAPERPVDAGEQTEPEQRHGDDCQCVRCQGFQGGNDLSLRHGAYSVVALGPRVEILGTQIRSLLDEQLGSAVCEADAPSIALLALALAQVEAATTWLNEHGLIDEHDQPRGLLRHLGTMLNTAARIADRLGMTPTARAALGLDLVTAKGAALRAHLVENYGEEGDG